MISEVDVGSFVLVESNGSCDLGTVVSIGPPVSVLISETKTIKVCSLNDIHVLSFTKRIHQQLLNRASALYTLKIDNYDDLPFILKERARNSQKITYLADKYAVVISKPDYFNDTSKSDKADILSSDQWISDSLTKVKKSLLNKNLVVNIGALMEASLMDNKNNVSAIINDLTSQLAQNDCDIIDQDNNDLISSRNSKEQSNKSDLDTYAQTIASTLYFDKTSQTVWIDGTKSLCTILSELLALINCYLYLVDCCSSEEMLDMSVDSDYFTAKLEEIKTSSAIFANNNIKNCISSYYYNLKALNDTLGAFLCDSYGVSCRVQFSVTVDYCLIRSSKKSRQKHTKNSQNTTNSNRLVIKDVKLNYLFAESINWLPISSESKLGKQKMSCIFTDNMFFDSSNIFFRHVLILIVITRDSSLLKQYNDITITCSISLAAKVRVPNHLICCLITDEILNISQYDLSLIVKQLDSIVSSLANLGVTCDDILILFELIAGTALFHLAAESLVNFDGNYNETLAEGLAQCDILGEDASNDNVSANRKLSILTYFLTSFAYLDFDKFMLKKAYIDIIPQIRPLLGFLLNNFSENAINGIISAALSICENVCLVYQYWDMFIEKTISTLFEKLRIAILSSFQLFNIPISRNATGMITTLKFYVSPYPQSNYCYSHIESGDIDQRFNSRASRSHCYKVTDFFNTGDVEPFQNDKVNLNRTPDRSRIKFNNDGKTSLYSSFYTVPYLLSYHRVSLIRQVLLFILITIKENEILLKTSMTDNLKQSKVNSEKTLVLLPPISSLILFFGTQIIKFFPYSQTGAINVKNSVLLNDILTSSDNQISYSNLRSKLIKNNVVLPKVGQIFSYNGEYLLMISYLFYKVLCQVLDTCDFTQIEINSKNINTFLLILDKLYKCYANRKSDKLFVFQCHVEEKDQLNKVSLDLINIARDLAITAPWEYFKDFNLRQNIEHSMYQLLSYFKSIFTAYDELHSAMDRYNVITDNLLTVFTKDQLKLSFTNLIEDFKSYSNNIMYRLNANFHIVNFSSTLYDKNSFITQDENDFPDNIPETLPPKLSEFANVLQECLVAQSDQVTFERCLGNSINQNLVTNHFLNIDKLTTEVLQLAERPADINFIYSFSTTDDHDSLFLTMGIKSVLKYSCEALNVYISNFDLIIMFDILIPIDLYNAVLRKRIELKKNDSYNFYFENRKLYERVNNELSKIFMTVFSVPATYYSIEFMFVRMKSSVYAFIQEKSKYLKRRSEYTYFIRLQSVLKTLICKYKYQQKRKIITRIQARWKHKVFQLKLETNKVVFLPILFAIIKTSKLLAPNSGISGSIDLTKTQTQFTTASSPEFIRRSAATQIQCWFRMVLAKRKLEALKEQYVEKEAASVIQSLIKTFVAFCSFHLVSINTSINSDYHDPIIATAATIIQAFWRAKTNPTVIRYRMIKKGFKNAIFPIITVTSRLEQFRSFQKLISLKNHSKVMNKNIRTAVDFEFHQYFCQYYSVKIQSKWRQYFVRKQYILSVETAKYLQTLLHVQLYRRRFVNYVQSAYKIQSWWKALILLRGVDSKQIGFVTRRKRCIPSFPEQLYIEHINDVLLATRLNRKFAKRTVEFVDESKYSTTKANELRARASEIFHKGYSSFLNSGYEPKPYNMCTYINNNLAKLIEANLKKQKLPFLGNILDIDSYKYSAIIQIDYNYYNYYAYEQSFTKPLFILLIRFIKLMICRDLNLTRMLLDSSTDVDDDLYDSKTVEGDVVKYNKTVHHIELIVFNKLILSRIHMISDRESPMLSYSKTEPVFRSMSERYQEKLERKKTVRKAVSEMFKAFASFEPELEDINSIRLFKDMIKAQTSKNNLGYIRSCDLNNVRRFIQALNFSVIDLKVTDNFTLVHMSESTKDFLNKRKFIVKMSHHTKYTPAEINSLGEAFTFVFGYGSNTNFELTYEGPGLPLKADVTFVNSLEHLSDQGKSEYKKSLTKQLASHVEAEVNELVSGSQKNDNIIEFTYDSFATQYSTFLIRFVHEMTELEFREYINKLNSERRRLAHESRLTNTWATRHTMKSKKQLGSDDMSDNEPEDIKIENYTDQESASVKKQLDEVLETNALSKTRKESYRHGHGMYDFYDKEYNKVSLYMENPQISRIIDYTFRIVKVEVGNRFALALTNDGKLFSWGVNKLGQCGQGSEYDIIPEPRLVPFVTANQRVVIDMVCGPSHAMCVLDDFKVFIWGDYHEVHLATSNRQHIYYPTEIPLLNLLKISKSNKLNVIREREKLKFELENPGHAYSSVYIARDPTLPYFGSSRSSQKITTIDPSKCGQMPNEDVRLVGCDETLDTVKDAESKREAWILERGSDNKVEEIMKRRNDKVSAILEQKKRREDRRMRYAITLQECKLNAQREAEYNYLDMRQKGMTIEELADLGIVDYNKTVDPETNQATYDVVVKVQDYDVPNIESDSDLVVSDFSDIGQEVAYWGPEFNACTYVISDSVLPDDFGLWKRLNQNIKLNKDVEPVEKYNFDPKTIPVSRSINYKKDVFVFDWHGVSLEERLWIENLERISNNNWSVVGIKISKTLNTIHLRCVENDAIKDIILVWGQSMYGELGIPFNNVQDQKTTAKGVDSRTNPAVQGSVSSMKATQSTSCSYSLGWFPVFLWFGNPYSLVDHNYKIYEYCIGKHNVIALVEFNKRLNIFIWGTFRVDNYNSVRSLNQYLIDQAKDKNTKNTNVLSFGKAKSLFFAKNANINMTDNKSPYTLVDDEDLWRDNIVGKVTFQIPCLIFLPPQYQPKHVWSNISDYEIGVTAHSIDGMDNLILRSNTLSINWHTKKVLASLKSGPSHKKYQDSAYYAPIIAPVNLNMYGSIENINWKTVPVNNSMLLSDHDLKIVDNGCNPHVIGLKSFMKR